MTKRQKAMEMAWLVERLLRDPRGVRLETLMEESGRSPRSMRGWLQELREDYPGLRGPGGASLVEVTGEREARRVSLRRGALLDGTDGHTLGGVVLAASMLSELEGTGLDRVGEELVRAYTASLTSALRRDVTCPDMARKLVVAHPERADTWGRSRVVEQVVCALLRSVRVRVTRRWVEGVVTFEPLSLVYRGGELSVVAREPACEPRVFALQDLMRVEVTHDVFTYPGRHEYDPLEVLAGASAADL